MSEIKKKKKIGIKNNRNLNVNNLRRDKICVKSKNKRHQIVILNFGVRVSSTNNMNGVF